MTFEKLEAEMQADMARIRKDLAKHTLKWFGKRCPNFYGKCSCCKAWRAYDQVCEVMS